MSNLSNRALILVLMREKHRVGAEAKNLRKEVKSSREWVEYLQQFSDTDKKLERSQRWDNLQFLVADLEYAEWLERNIDSQIEASRAKFPEYFE